MIQKYTLKNKNGYALTVLNLGGIIHEIIMPDRAGNYDNIVHGFERLEDYLENDAYFGAIIGRVAGRIAQGKFSLGDQEFSMPTKDRGNGLHGGIKGLDKQYWLVTEEGNKVILKHRSEDGAEGFPGTLELKVVYELSDDNQLIMEYEAVSDQDTYLNLTNHTYFNLNPKGNILNHTLEVQSDYIIELDESSIPTGILLPVEGTPFDFTDPKTIGRDLYQKHPQLIQGNGYDHPWVLKKTPYQARLSETETGRSMTMYSDQNALVLYSYNFPVKGEAQHLGLAVEFQNDPDSMHHDHFNSCLLKKGQVYRQKTVYHFSVE